MSPMDLDAHSATLLGIVRRNPRETREERDQVWVELRPVLRGVYRELPDREPVLAALRPLVLELHGFEDVAHAQEIATSTGKKSVEVALRRDAQRMLAHLDALTRDPVQALRERPFGPVRGKATTQWLNAELAMVEVIRALDAALHAQWNASEEPRWMLCVATWLDHRDGVRRAVAAAKTALPFVLAGENRPRIALETTERWLAGKATLDDVRAAANAADIITNNAVYDAAEANAAEASYAAAEASYYAYAASADANAAANNAAAFDAARNAADDAAAAYAYYYDDDDADWTSTHQRRLAEIADLIRLPVPSIEAAVRARLAA